LADTDLSLQAKLRKLTLAYAKELPAKLSEIGKLWMVLRNTWSREQAESFYRQVHSLSGSSGSYGATELHLQSRELEKIVVSVKENDLAPASSVLTEIDVAFGLTANTAGAWAEEFVNANNHIDEIEVESANISTEVEGESGLESSEDPQFARPDFRLLYVEDNPANLNLVKQLIRSRWPNAELLTAEDPVTGLKLLEKFEFKIVLLDINLPIMSGYDVLVRIREKEATRNLPVIAVSALAMPADVQAGYDAGFNEYITKPIKIENFFEVIDQFLAQNQG